MFVVVNSEGRELTREDNRPSTRKKAQALGKRLLARGVTRVAKVLEVRARPDSDGRRRLHARLLREYREPGQKAV